MWTVILEHCSNLEVVWTVILEQCNKLMVVWTVIQEHCNNLGVVWTVTEEHYNNFGVRVLRHFSTGQKPFHIRTGVCPVIAINTLQGFPRCWIFF
jgi:transposase-like protein